MRLVYLAAALSISFYYLCATELQPWYGQMLEIDTQAAGQLQAYRSVCKNTNFVKHPACDLFFNLSAGSSYNEFAGEFEAVASDTRYRSFGMDCIRLTARYRWMNDIVGEPISLVQGVTITQVFKPGLRNLSSFHHGGIESEFHLAAGKEFSSMQFWTSRFWSVVGIGIADMGYPWVRGDAAWEHNFCDAHQVRLFAKSLWGLGHKVLNPNHSFHGYGPIRHQLIDIGLRYSKFLEGTGITLSIEYAYRLYARNCPAQVNSLYASLNYPFGL